MPSRPSSAGTAHELQYSPQRASSGTKASRRRGHVDMNNASMILLGSSTPESKAYLAQASPPRPRSAKSRISASAPSILPPSPSPPRNSRSRHSHSGHLQAVMGAQPIHIPSNRSPYGRQSLDGAASLGPKQPLYQYIRPNKDVGTLSYSPSSSPPNRTRGGFPVGSLPASRSTSVDMTRPGHTSVTMIHHRPTSTSTSASTSRHSSPRASMDRTRPSSPLPQRSNFLDIEYRPGMSTEDVQMPGPDSLSPAGRGVPISFGGSIGHRNGASMSGQMEQYLSLSTAHQVNGAIHELETASGRHRFTAPADPAAHEKDQKKKKGGGWKRLSAGFKSLVGRS